MAVIHQERVIGRSLRAGVWSSVILLLAGIIVTGLEGPSVSPGLGLGDLPGILQRSGKDLSPGIGLLYAGLLVLALTPVIRVAATILVFLRQQDWRFLTISLLVFTVLVVELTLALT